MSKLLAVLCVAAVLLQVVVATEVEADKPKGKGKKGAKKPKMVKPHMHPRFPHHHHPNGVVIVPKGDARARAPTVAVMPDGGVDVQIDRDVWVAGDLVLPIDDQTLVVDADYAPYEEVARDIERRYFGAGRRSSRFPDQPDARILAPFANNQPQNTAAQVPQVPTTAPAAARAPLMLRNTPGAGCIALGGACGKVSACSGTIKTGMCPGDNTISCCVPKPATPTTPTTPTPTTPTTPTVPASSGLPMCSNNGASSGSYDGVSPLLATKNVGTRWSLAPTISYAQEQANGNSYRAPRDAYGNLPETDARLVVVPSSDSRTMKLHKVCAARFFALAAAAKAAGQGDLKVASGWRPHLWRNDYNYYCAEMKKQYPDRTCQQAGQVRAFKSAHETGLAFDLGAPSPMSPQLTLKPTQLKSRIFAWMRDNAHKYGITPYQYEPWHWECVIPRESWVKACEFTTNYSTRIRETRNDNGKLTSSTGGW